MFPRNVSVSSGPKKYLQDISVGHHVFSADEPAEIGGNDAGPNSQELLLASLAACANITVQMYAERHQWPLKGVQSTASYSRVLAENPPDSDVKIGMIDRIELKISFTGDLSPEQTQRLWDIAARCPVHRMLTSSLQVVTQPMAANFAPP
jgi:putative redox protein